MRRFGLLVSCFSSVLALAMLGVPAKASESEPLANAQHVIIGEVVNVFTREVKMKEGVQTNYVVEIKVAKTVKGDGFRPGKVGYFHMLTYKADLAAPPAGSPPRPSVPKPGAHVQVFLIQDAEGRFRCLHNGQAIVPFNQPKDQEVGPLGEPRK